jgi:O-antigen/teichoic acid export membrane protein
LVSPQLLPLLFGNTYVDAGRVTAVLTIGYLALSLSLPCTRILSMVKRTDLIFRASLISVVVNVVGNLLLIPRYGMIGAALATAGALVLNNVLLQWGAWRSYGFTFVDHRSISLMGAVLIAGVALVGVGALMREGLLALFVGTAVFGAVYLTTLPLLGALDASDREVLQRLNGRIREKWARG